MELCDPIELESYASESLSAGRRREALTGESQFTPEVKTHSERENTPTQSSVTRAVHPNWKLGSCNFMGIPEDITVISFDSIRFHVHQACLLAASSNMFDGFMPVVQYGWEQDAEEVNGQDVIYLPEAASVINVLLFAAYNRLPSTSILDVSRTSLSDLRLVIVALKTYGISVRSTISETSLMFATFASYCPIAALQVYIIAASNAPDLHAVAAYASQFLLSLDLSAITEEVAVEMGPLYLRKLFLLHLKRTKEFKWLIVGLPRPHRSLPHCDDINGKALKEAWTFATALLLSSSASPSMSNSEIDNAVASVMDQIACTECKESLRNHALNLKQQWSLVKKTI